MSGGLQIITLTLQKVQKEPIPEEQEMDFRPVEEGEERSDSEGSHNEEAKDHEKNKKEGEKTERVVAGKGGDFCNWQGRISVNSVT